MKPDLAESFGPWKIWQEQRRIGRRVSDAPGNGRERNTIFSFPFLFNVLVRVSNSVLFGAAIFWRINFWRHVF